MSLCLHNEQTSPLGVIQSLDHLEWKIEDFSDKIDSDFITQINLEKDLCEIFFMSLVSSHDLVQGDENYIRDKIFRLNQRIDTLVPVEPVIDHQNFSKKVYQVAQVDEKDSCLPSVSTSKTDDERAISKMIQHLTKNDKLSFVNVLQSLPSDTQNEIYRKHWEMMGKPTKTSPDSYLRSIAHPDFGRVSLLGLDSRCDVSSAKKMQTLQAFMANI